MGSETSKVIGDLSAFVEKTVVKIVDKVTTTLEEDTPELTGHAESNWIPQIGAPVAEPFGSRLSVSFAAQEQGLAVVAGSYKLPNTVYITNAVDYISSLNRGTSAKAPANFVQTAIAKAIKSVV